MAAGRIKDPDKIGIAAGKIINMRKVAKHFILDITEGRITWRRDQASIDAEAATDGIYVIRTPVPAETLDAPAAVAAYKDLARLERDFRHLKADDLDLRPIWRARGPGPRPRADLHARLLPDLASAPGLGPADLHRRTPPGPRQPRRPCPPLTIGCRQGRLQDRPRMAEVYAGFLAHADHHIGRLLDYLEESGQRENTMVILVSDNGASGEGGPDGSVNENKLFNGMPDDLQANLAMLDELGGTKTYNHYPNGWAMAFNTPFKMWKRYEFNGGTADPCIISWPSAIAGAAAGRGELRHQYHHAIDIAPTILDSVDVEPPETIKGHVQSRFDRVSMRYSAQMASCRPPSTRTARIPPA